ncbi:MAG: O-antigen ligase family protein [Thiotrichaceae bacterium]
MNSAAAMTSSTIKLLTVLAGLLIFSAPLFMNQYKEMFELVAQVVGVAMLVVLFWTQGSLGKIGYANGLFLIVSVAFVGLYLIPAPEAMWETLPGRGLYADVASFISAQGVEVAYPSLSLIPENTKRALFYLIPLLALFLVTMSLPKSNVHSLVIVLFVIVIIETGLGIVQYASGVDIFYIGNDEHGNTASGTYRNRDHFVGLIELVLPLVIGMLVASFSPSSNRSRGSLLSGTLTLTLLVVLMILVSFFSASRAGIGLVVLGLMISAFAFSHHVGKVKSFGFLLIASIVGVAVAFKVGVVPILNRFASDPMEDERWRIFENTQRAITDMLPWGSGPGTFPEMYRAYQPIEQHNFVNHAHNDYLEIISDMGLLGGIIIGAFVLLYLVRWFYIFRGQSQGLFKNLQIGAGIGMFLLLLHSFVDFNLHQAANALIFVFLAGIFFRLKRAT